MNELYLGRMPIVTGTPSSAPQQQTQQAPQTSFAELLKRQQMELTFSKHAVQRVEQRSIALTEANLSRLNEGVRLAQQKGLTDTLILVDSTAFLVHVPDNKVITTIQQDDLKGNVFTNIDGAVVI